PNAGLYRAITVSAPKGSILNCDPPAAVGGRTQTCQRVVDLVHGALAPAVPDRIIAACNGTNAGMSFSGVDPRTESFYVYLETQGGGFGARATKDGMEGVQVHITNTSNLPVECLESEYPLAVDQYELVNDSGGPGRWRGGMGIHRQIRVVEGEAIFWGGGTRVTTAPWGLFGGKEGASMRVIVHRDPSKGPPREATRLRTGEAVSLITPGGGGYGDPRERDRELVARDLREEKISLQQAVEGYGFTSES
ncbi:MAG: hydantoinase B/oxoprolinase family protein, partial [Chloroflexi bacterium]|nr:hydantoinase B/oxoprolinase family protein [Chloroflexota bacterium]